MTQLKPFRETMTEIGNVFGFSDIQLDELEKYYKLEQQPDLNPFDKKTHKCHTVFEKLLR